MVVDNIPRLAFELDLTTSMAGAQRVTVRRRPAEWVFGARSGTGLVVRLTVSSTVPPPALPTYVL